MGAPPWPQQPAPAGRSRHRPANVAAVADPLEIHDVQLHWGDLCFKSGDRLEARGTPVCWLAYCSPSWLTLSRRGLEWLNEPSWQVRDELGSRSG